MQEAQAIATLVLTGALAVLALLVAAALALALVAVGRAAGALEAIGRDGARAAKALGDAAQSVARMARGAEGAVTQTSRAVRRLAFLERVLERRLARAVLLTAAAIEGFTAVRRAMRDAGRGAARREASNAAQGEEETADVGGRA
jgi:hypothetical protein